MRTPLEETCRAMNFLIEQGLTFYWGTSEWTANQIEKAFKICEKLNLIPPICDVRPPPASTVRIPKHHALSLGTHRQEGR